MISPRSNANTLEEKLTPKQNRQRSSSHRRSSSYFADDLNELTAKVCKPRTNNTEEEEKSVEGTQVDKILNLPLMKHHPLLSSSFKNLTSEPVTICEPIEIKIPSLGIDNAKEFLAARKPQRPFIGLKTETEDSSTQKKRMLNSLLLQRH
jgi:hypothetical protein